MAPYFCYIHHGLYVKGEEGAEGCHDQGCLDFAAKAVPYAGIYLTGFGGSRVAKAGREQSRQFHKDMYAFKDAVDQGVKPNQVTAVAAERALKHAEAVSDGIG